MAIGRRLKWAGVAAAATALAVGVGAVVWQQLPETRSFYTDTESIRTPEGEARIRDVLWRPPVKLSEIVNTADEDYEPRISWDGLTLFFVRGKAGANSDIYYSQRTPGGWSEPAAIEALNSEYEDLGPEPSADGTMLYFYSDRPGGEGGYDIWTSRRGDEGWGTPTNLGPAVNSEFNDYGPALTPDGGTLYYASNRPTPEDVGGADAGAWPATVREDLFRRTYDLYAAEKTPGGFAAARALNELNTPENEGAPCVSPAGDFLYFSSDRAGGSGGFDIYRARRMGEGFETASNLGPTLNTEANELDPGLTHLGYALYFSSDRAEGASGRGDYDLYYTTSREVFLDVVSTQRPPIDWAALLRGNLPNLIWLLLALLALLAAWAMAGSLRDGKLGLLARCLLASLLLHMLLMFCFSFWKVSASVISAFKQRGEIQIALASPKHGDELAAQICGALTDAAPVEAASFELARFETPVENEPHDARTELPAETARMEFVQRPTVELAAHEAMRPVRDESYEAPLRAAEIANETPAELMELKLPEAEGRRARVDETRAVAEAVTETDAEITRPVVQSPTSQPALRTNQLAAEGDLRGAAIDGASMAGEIAASDGRAREERPFETFADVRPVKAEYTFDVAAPSEIERRVKDKETGPRAAAERVESTRPALAFEVESSSSAALDALNDGEPDWEAANIDAAGMIAVKAKEAEGRGSFASPETEAVKTAASAPLDLALPAMDESEGERREESGPTVEASRTATERPDVRAYAAVDPKDATTAYEALAPSEVKREELAPVKFDVTPLPTNDDARAATRRESTPETTVHERRDPLALALALPDETEPPPAFEDSLLTGAPLRGRVYDADTQEPLGGATIRLDLPEQEALLVVTDDEGRYALAVPPVPDHFALSATREGYIPESINVPAADLEDGVLMHDFALTPMRDDVIAVENEPEVHHLGNDRWDGVINSQFQRESEGRIFRATFEITEQQLGRSPERPTVRMLTKGVQCPHRIYINGWRMRNRLDESPRDGGFGEYQATFDSDMLVEGENTIEIHGVSCHGDLDDFEFVNIRIDLSN